MKQRLNHASVISATRCLSCSAIYSLDSTKSNKKSHEKQEQYAQYEHRHVYNASELEQAVQASLSDGAHHIFQCQETISIYSPKTGSADEANICSGVTGGGAA